MIRGCGECGAALAADQRYCLQCGALDGARRVDPLATLGFAAEPAAPAEPLVAERRGPSRRVAAVAAAATLAVGLAVGAALGPGPAPTLAAAPQRVVALVIPSAAPDPATTTASEAPPPQVAGTPDTPAPEPAAASSDTAAAGDTPAAPAAGAGTAAGPDTSAGTDTTGDDDSASDDTPAATAPAPAAAPHVWIVTLSGLDATAAFGPASPLADLVARGTLLTGYAPAAPTAAANGVALLGGQVPTADCAADLAACVLPASEPSLPAQLAGAGQTWKAYVEDPAARAPQTPDARVAPSLFTGLTAKAGTLAPTDALPTDLAKSATTPELSVVVPAAGGLDASPAVHDAVAKITAAPAYKDNGLLLVVVDSPPAATDPAAPLPATGALVLSPRATAGATVATPTGPVALLRSLEDLFGLPPLGSAAQAPAGALDGVLAPAVATASAASIFPPPRSTTTTRRSP